MAYRVQRARDLEVLTGRVRGSGKYTRIGAYRDRVAERRGPNIGKVAAARELIDLVYYALRDGIVRRILSASA
ncbi:MAG: hypothetical protein ACRDWT_00285 [Jatrophihabitantaceae bacterium]